MSAETPIKAGALVILLGLVCGSLYLAAMRIFQVDECFNIRAAYNMALDQPGREAKDLYQYVLSVLLHGGTRSIDWFVQGRFIMVEVFWLNILLLALATGAKLTRSGGLWVLLGAATLAPLWDYGFELRHDNLLLTSLLLLWCVVRHSRRNMAMYAVGGVVGMFSLGLATKSAIYVLPLTVALFIAPSKECNVARWKLILSWLAGGASMLILLLALSWRSGFMGNYAQMAVGIASMAVDGARFWPWKTFGRLLAQAPLLTAVTVAGLVTVGVDGWRNRKRTSLWDSPAPEALALLVVVLTLFVNPTPYPYNLIYVVPFMFLFACRAGAPVLHVLWSKRELRVMIVALLAFTHFVPFVVATQRHVDRPNGRQEGLMALSESLSDPVKDPVYDGIGMVPTRPIVAYEAFIHGTYVRKFREGKGPTIRAMLERNPPVVIIQSYRTGWLPQEDHAFIGSRYVALADDFLVLGKILPPGGGELEIVHPGRYRIASLQASDLAGTYPDGLQGMILNVDGPEFGASLNGLPLQETVVDLDVGTCRVECNPRIQPTVVWVGPKLNRLPRLADGSHRDLFVNWY